MEVLKVPGYKILLMYSAVRLFDSLAWSGNKRKKKKELTRVADMMPIKSVEVVASLRVSKETREMVREESAELTEEEEA